MRKQKGSIAEAKVILNAVKIKEFVLMRKHSMKNGNEVFREELWRLNESLKNEELFANISET